MALPDQTPSDPQPYIATIEYLGARYTVSCRVMFDGIEHVGRLWFSDEGTDHDGSPDRASIPGATRDEVLERARRLTPDELNLRHRRALAEKRRFLKLRSATDEMLAKIRYLNQVAISVRAGWIDEDGANQEIELTEQQLREAVDLLRDCAGVEDELLGD